MVRLGKVKKSRLAHHIWDNYNKPPSPLPDTLREPFPPPDEEQILVDWLFHSAKKGFPRRKEDLQISVKCFLDEKPRDNPFKDNMPADGWYKAFLMRHPTLSERVPEAVTAASTTVSEADIRKWFLNIETYLKQENYFDIL
ncbi:piggybac transposable element-derived protein 4 [Holotrichia oblita]|uniref:Piggybac transposable element-derived protein 4 n=1 Tax=Holotrichia oblita TaxID=644536 RepID=A0ACB9TJ61_HOLOL|nr:piggybac transposable element-derived protein 4 [Holotrichia oblita]